MINKRKCTEVLERRLKKGQTEEKSDIDQAHQIAHLDPNSSLVQQRQRCISSFERNDIRSEATKTQHQRQQFQHHLQRLGVRLGSKMSIVENIDLGSIKSTKKSSSLSSYGPTIPPTQIVLSNTDADSSNTENFAQVDEYSRSSAYSDIRRDGSEFTVGNELRRFRKRLQLMVRLADLDCRIWNDFDGVELLVSDIIPGYNIKLMCADTRCLLNACFMFAQIWFVVEFFRRQDICTRLCFSK